MVIAEDYAFPYSQVQGFMSEYCRSAARCRRRLGAAGRQGLLVGDRQDPEGRRRAAGVLGGADAVNFLTSTKRRRADKPILGGSITVSQDVLNYRGKRRDSLVGTLSAGPLADAYDAPTGRRSSPTTRRTTRSRPAASRARACSPTCTTWNMKAALDGWPAVNGDLSATRRSTARRCRKMSLKTPNGDVRLDANRQAIGTTFVTEVVKDAQGNLFNKVHSKVDNVEQLLA
jgi:branched-chain amino acid transport system substrate-binding protein